MLDKNSTGKFVLGVAILAVLKLACVVIWNVIKVLANVIVYFGLYVPFFYFLLGGVFVGIGAFSFGEVSINMILFYVGLALCFGVSICIFVRTYAKKPLRSVAEGSVRAVRTATRARKKQPQRRVVADTEAESSTAKCPMLVYYSQEHPNELVHEFDDHFDVYYDDRVHPVSFLWRIDKPKNAEGA